MTAISYRFAGFFAAIVAAPLLFSPSADAANFDKCGLDQGGGIKAGISPNIVNAAFRDITFDEKAVRFSRTQPEYRLAIWDYMAFLVDEARLADGAKMMRNTTRRCARSRKPMASIATSSQRSGVSKATTARRRAISSCRMRSPMSPARGKKPAVFTSELIQALRIVQAGDVKLSDIKGSWAGAFGQTQFMPSTYRRLAVDFDGDGHRDTIRSVPDALASAANFLKKAGWQSGLSWGFEVKVPGSYKGPVGRGRKSPIAAWAKHGITRADGSALPKSGILWPDQAGGASGPAFLVSRNFDVLYTYNAAESYALAIGHLSDRLQGKGGLQDRLADR